MREKKMKSGGGKRNKRVLWTCLIAACAAALSLAAVTGAKYVLQWSPGVTQADAKAFYFTSDLLTSGDTPVYQLANFVPGDDADSSRITFTLRNYADELRVSEASIDYTVSTDASGVTHPGGTIAVADKTASVSLSVPAACFTDGRATVRVSAAATSPYAKTLAAEFELYEKITDVSRDVHDADGSNTVTLTVTTGDKAGTVNISFPTAVYPDRTDSRLTCGGSTCSFNAAANAQYSFVFFKSSPGTVYTEDSFPLS